MTTVGIFEAKNRLSELVERAARGEEIVITRRGEQVARLMPPRAKDALGPALALASRIRRSRAGQLLGDGTSIRDMTEEGRRVMPQDDQEGQECRCQTRLAAQADASDGSLQRLMDEALADLDGWIE